MWCSELEVILDPRNPQALEEYVAGFFPEPPASNFALEGLLGEYVGEDDEGSSSSGLDFRILAASGPWDREMGAQGAPRLQRLRFRWHLDGGAVEAEEAGARSDEAEGRRPMPSARAAASLCRTWQILRCRGLHLPPSAIPVASGAPPRPGEQGLSFTLDTAKAYHWMRFSGYLHWARHIVDSITAARPDPGSVVLDLGGGSGWMAAILRAHLGSECEVLCTDIAEEALDLARDNFRENGLSVATARGDLFEPVKLRGPPLPSFIFFYPPQDASEVSESSWRGSPDVSLRAPDGEAVHFHARFCREAVLEPGGRAWLAVDWSLLDEVAEICCGEGWEVELPEATRDLTWVPSTLMELRRAGPGHSPEECLAHAKAQIQLCAECQIRAIGTSDPAARSSSFRQAAERGFPGGQLNFGSALAAGAGVEKDQAAAANWFLRAAEAGEAVAQLNLGTLMADMGRDAEAAQWYRKAAEQGHIRAQSALSALFVDGKLPLSADGQAMRWIRRSAERDETGAQVLLAKLHLKGEGVPRSREEAASWLRRAAAGSTDPQEAEALSQAAASLESVGPR